MTTDWQTWSAFLVVAIAAGLLLRSALKKRKNPGCGGGCGCPTDKFKKNLKSADV